MAIEITTNNHWKELIAKWELPTEVAADFDYVDENSGNRFFQYRGVWYDANEFTFIISSADSIHGLGHRVEADSPLASWHGISTDSFYSGVVIRYEEDLFGSGPLVQVGTAIEVGS